MSANWDWVDPIRAAHFGEPLLGAYAIERVADAASYWRLHEAELRRHFPPECFIDLGGLLSEDERRGRERLATSAGGDPLADFWVARDGDAVVAMFCGHQKDEDTYRMWHSHVHPSYRGRGVYAEIVRRTIAYTRDLRFSTVVSEHAPSNNAILVAKLKAGFRLVSMDIDPKAGVSAILKYFHNEAHLRAYEFRCGLATLDERLLANGAGAFPELVNQIRRTPPGVTPSAVTRRDHRNPERE